MIDFADGSSWFIAGLTTTIVLTLLLLLVIWAASRADHRH